MQFADYKPQLAKAAASVADAPGSRKVVEAKLDGHRALAFVDEDGLRIFSRSGKTEHAGKLPLVDADLARFPAGTVLDGEMLCADVDEGQVVHRWASIQSILGSDARPSTHPDADRVVFVAFDLLAHGGLDARPLTLEQRRQLLRSIFADHTFARLQLAEQMPATEETYELLVERGFEGAVVKDLDAPYASGARGRGWSKIKPTETTDAFVVGYVEGTNGLTGQVGALRLAQVGADGRPVEVGVCGSGISDVVRAEIDADRAGWIGRVVEVVQLAAGGDNWSPMSLRRLRPDKDAADCVAS